MSRSLVLSACLMTLLLSAGCNSGSPGNGLTFEESESREADSSVTPAPSSVELQVGEPQQAEVDLNEPIIPVLADGSGSDTDDPESAISSTDPTADSEANPAPTGELTPQQQAAQVGVELTPEQWEALDGAQLSPEQWAALANINLLIPDQLFFRAGNALRVQFDNLDLEKVLNMTYIPPFATDYFPEWMMELDGQRVRLRGYMYTTFDGVDSFLLCRDLGPCCFGPNPRSDYRIPIHLQEGETTDYIHQTVFEVEGIFHVHLTIDDLGKVSHVYAVTEGTVIRL